MNEHDETCDSYSLQPVPDYEPVRGPTRLLVEIDGSRFAETDPVTGVTLRIGEIGR